MRRFISLSRPSSLRPAGNVGGNRFTHDHLDLAAEGPGAFVMNAERHDAERHALREGIQRDAHRAALERQMTRAQRTGAFRKND